MSGPWLDVCAPGDIEREDVMRFLPFLDHSEHCRFPIYGGLFQQRAGTVRHDAVAWGYARAADALGYWRRRVCPPDPLGMSCVWRTGYSWNGSWY